MARRTKEEAAATREALLESAERLFRDKGVAHTSLAEVAQAAGLTRGAVYWHFRDKAALFEALCDRVTLPMEALRAEAGDAEQTDPLGALRTLMIDGLRQLATDARAQAVFDVIFNKCEFTAELASVAERQRSTDCGCLTHIERLLQQAATLGQLPPDTDVPIAAKCTNAFMVGAMHQWVRNPAAYDLARAAPAMVDTIIAGLAARPPLAPARTPAVRAAHRPRARVAG